MKISRLDFDQFQHEKDQLLSTLIGWYTSAQDYYQKNFNYLNDAKSTKMSIYHYWKEAIERLIKYLEREFQEDRVAEYKSRSFRFFLAEDNGLQGIAWGVIETHREIPFGPTLFGVHGTYYEIMDIIISPSNLLPLCFPVEPKYQQTLVEKALLIDIVNFVNALPRVYPISLVPDNGDDTTAQFLMKNLFQPGGGMMGCAYTLAPNKFDLIKKIHNANIGSNQVFVIDDYDTTSRRLTMV